jgi:hypothetical protein
VKSLEGVELELQCACGHENFERVVVQRAPGAPIVTDFVACVGCRAMYFAPLPKAAPRAPSPGDKLQAIGPPPPARSWPGDSDAALRRDAAEAAKDYVKPGRPTPPKPRRRG